MANTSEPVGATTAAQPAPTEVTPTETTPAPAPITTQPPTTTATADAPQPAAVPTVPTETAAPAAPAAPEKALDEPEPQNTLTERFTAQEWTALKEFRALLPEIFAGTFPDDLKAKETPTTMWGVKIDPSNPRDAKVSVVLMKFLRARNLNITEAQDMLQSTLRWRKSFNIEAAMQEVFPEGRFDAMGRFYGKDKEGRPVMYNIYGGGLNLKEVFSDVQMFLRWRVALHERMMQMLDFETVDQTLQVHDYLGVGLTTSRDANSKNAAREATNIFASHYPELLYKKFFINVPSILSWIFWAFKPLLAPATVAKMSVVGTGAHTIHQALGPHIDDKELPVQYGGQAEGF